MMASRNVCPHCGAALASTVATRDVERVFEAWSQRAQELGVRRGPLTLTHGRRTKIEQRLRQGYSADDLVRAVHAGLASDFHRTKPMWTELSSLLGSAEKVDRHLANAEGGGQSAVDQRITRLLDEASA